MKQLNTQLSQQKYQSGDIIYEIGSNAEVMYILMSGKLAQETEVEIEEENRFPIGKNRWEVNVTHRRVQYEIRQVMPNEIFGHQELIALLEQEASMEEKKFEIVRECRMKALTACEVIYINKEHFEKCK